MLDFDGPAPDGLADRLALVARLHRVRVRCVRYDRTRHGWHVVVWLSRRLSLGRVVLLQALLGSDWKRELFNSVRVTRLHGVGPMWRDRTNVLFTRHTRSVHV